MSNLAAVLAVAGEYLGPCPVLESGTFPTKQFHTYQEYTNGLIKYDGSKWTFIPWRDISRELFYSLKMNETSGMEWEEWSCAKSDMLKAALVITN